MMEGPGADSEEKHEPASDIDTAWMDSLKVLDPEGPIREADIAQYSRHAQMCQQRPKHTNERPCPWPAPLCKAAIGGLMTIEAFHRRLIARSRAVARP
jgi:hypothetical protein